MVKGKKQKVGLRHAKTRVWTIKNGKPVKVAKKPKPKN